MAVREPLTHENAVTLIEELDRLVRLSDEDGEDLEAARTAGLILSSLEAAPGPADRIGEKLTALRAWTDVMLRDKKHAGPGSLRLRILEDLAALRDLIFEET